MMLVICLDSWRRGVRFQFWRFTFLEREVSHTTYGFIHSSCRANVLREIDEQWLSIGIQFVLIFVDGRNYEQLFERPLRPSNWQAHKPYNLTGLWKIESSKSKMKQLGLVFSPCMSSVSGLQVLDLHKRKSKLSRSRGWGRNCQTKRSTRDNSRANHWRNNDD